MNQATFTESFLAALIALMVLAATARAEQSPACNETCQTIHQRCDRTDVACNERNRKRTRRAANGKHGQSPLTIDTKRVNCRCPIWMEVR